MVKANRREVSFGIGLQVRAIVACHDETNLVDFDKDLLSALFDGNTLGLLCLHAENNLFTHAGDSLNEKLGFNRFDQVVDGIHLERIKRVFSISRNEHDGWRELQMLQGLGELQRTASQLLRAC